MAVESSAARLRDYKFRLEINGHNAALVQDFDPGRRTIGVSEHAGAGQNFPDKQAGMQKFADCVIKRVVPIDGTDRSYFEDWMNLCQDALTGNGQIPAIYQRRFSFYEMKPDGTDSSVYEYYGGFPIDISPGNRHGVDQNKDVIEEIHIAYQYRIRRAL